MVSLLPAPYSNISPVGGYVSHLFCCDPFTASTQGQQKGHYCVSPTVRTECWRMPKTSTLLAWMLFYLGKTVGQGKGSNIASNAFKRANINELKNMRKLVHKSMRGALWAQSVKYLRKDTLHGARQPMPKGG